MPKLSPECIKRLRDLDGQLGSIAFAINQKAAPGTGHPLNLSDAEKAGLSNLLGDTKPTAHAGDDDCKAIFRDLEPKIGSLIESIRGNHPVDAIRLHLENARTNLRAVAIGFD